MFPVNIKNNPIKRDKFDFEVGYLIKSPCLKCDNKDIFFPKCLDKCDMLDKIHTRLAQAISCSYGN